VGAVVGDGVRVGGSEAALGDGGNGSDERTSRHWATACMASLLRRFGNHRLIARYTLLTAIGDRKGREWIRTPSGAPRRS